MEIDKRKISTLFFFSGSVRRSQQSGRLNQSIFSAHFVWKPVWFVLRLSAGLSRWTGWRWTMTFRLMPSSPAQISTSRTLTSPTMVLTVAWLPTWWENPTTITFSTCMVSSQSLIFSPLYLSLTLTRTRSVSPISITGPFPLDITLRSEHSPILKCYWYHLQH